MQLRLPLALLLFLAVPAFAAVNAGMQWDIRTTGNAANAGGYDATVAAPGTNFAVQDAPQVVYTDLVVGGTTTHATSAAHPFDATSPGNTVNILSGTGCTAGRAEILSVSGSTATFDIGLGTAASVCTANLGGGLLTIASVLFSGGYAIPGNTLNIKTGTYTFTAQITTAGGMFPVTLSGYGSAWGDGGTKPLITTATNSTQLFNLNSGNKLIFRNLSFSNTASVRASAIAVGGAQANVFVAGCVFDGFTKALDGSNTAVFPILEVETSEFKNNSLAAIDNSTGSVTTLRGNVIHDNPGQGVLMQGGNQQLAASWNLIYNNGAGLANAAGIFFSSANDYNAVLANNDIYGNTGCGIGTNDTGFTAYLSLENNIFYGNSTWGLCFAARGFVFTRESTNAFGANASGNCQTCTLSASDLTGIADPFVNAAGGNFALSGAGVALKGAGYPGAYPLGLSTGHLDIGAVQSPGAGGAVAFAAP